MKSVRLLIVSDNHFLRYGWVCFVNKIQPEIISRTGKICDVTTFKSPDCLSKKFISSGVDYCILIERALTKKLSWRNFLSKNKSMDSRVFIINDARSVPKLRNDSMPFKPSLEMIRNLIIKAMINDDYSLENEIARVINQLNKTESLLLTLLIEGKSVSDIAAALKVQSKTIYYMRSKLLKTFGVSHLNELIRKNNHLDLVDCLKSNCTENS